MEDLSARADETPRHTVCISVGFWLDRFEVTSESFLQFAREGGAWGGIPGGSAADLRSARRAPWPANDRKNSHGARVIHTES